ncbi:MAG: hypothetical protein KGN00_12750 [Chloroflexota bacterium]|nr:hypothetical protein [Chloroflexota bacterium]
MKGALVLAAVLALTLARASVFAPPSRTGQWSLAGSLERPRAYATAVTVKGGDILVFGGLDENDPRVVNPTSELISPLTGKVTTLPGKVPGRLHQTATALPNGHLVVAGGVEWVSDHFQSVDRVDVFVPEKNAWIEAAPLLQARSDHGAAALPDGDVLVAGGNYNTRPLATSEIYDPRTDTWREAAPLSHPRVRFSMVSLPDGRVLVAGGLDQLGRPLATTEIYDPDKDRWSAGPDLSTPRVQHATVVLPNGDVLFIGGQDGASGTAERFDHVTGKMRYAGSLVTPRLVEQAALLPDGRVLVTGGSVEEPGRTNWVPFTDAEVWDPLTNKWRAFPSPKEPRALGDLVPTPAGMFLIGGIGTGEAAHRSIERLTLE